jgi:hypothetical protein
MLTRYSARINYDVACNMDFHGYPIDRQMCEIKYESFGYTNKQVRGKNHAPAIALLVFVPMTFVQRTFVLLVLVGMTFAPKTIALVVFVAMTFVQRTFVLLVLVIMTGFLIAFVLKQLIYWPLLQ